MNWTDLAKYFVHGVAFTILFLILGLAWLVALVILVGLGFIIGLIIGLGLLFLIIGFLNSAITSFLWFEVRDGFWTLLAHGFLLFIVLVVVNVIFVTVPNLAFPGLATAVVTFLIVAFVDGFVAKRVAGYWQEEYVENRAETTGAETPYWETDE